MLWRSRELRWHGRAEKGRGRHRKRLASKRHGHRRAAAQPRDYIETARNGEAEQRSGIATPRSDSHGNRSDSLGRGSDTPSTGIVRLPAPLRELSGATNSNGMAAHGRRGTAKAWRGLNRPGEATAKHRRETPRAGFVLQATTNLEVRNGVQDRVRDGNQQD